MYNVIHNNSAVNNMCNDVVALIKKVDDKIKNKISKTFKSPINKI